MNKFLKSLVTLSITTSLSISSVYAETYKVVDLGSSSTHKFTTAKAKNDSGISVLSASQLFNFPVQFDLLSDTDYVAIQSLAASTHTQDTLLGDIEDAEALKAGTPTANDFAWVVRYLQQTNRVKSSLYQKVGGGNILSNNGTDSVLVNVFDQKLSNDELSNSTTDIAYGVTNDSWIYGSASAPYLPVDFTDSNDNAVKHWLRAYSTRGFITTDNGNTVKAIIPTENQLGGESSLLYMNDNHIGVGYMSTAIKQSVLDSLVDETGGCADPDVLKDISYELCVQRALDFETDGAYTLEATKFTFDNQGNVTASESLGNLVTPNTEDTRIFKSYAQAINNNGVAVGFAHGWVKGEVAEPSTNEARSFYAVMYKDGKAISFTKEPTKEFNSRTFDINDAGIAVGYVTKSVNGSARTKFYYIDTNSSDLNLVFPNDFFSGSSSVATAINEQGLIVGQGEVETQNSGSSNPRRRHGFLYDINSEKFTDLNDFLTCNSGYTIIKADGINELNEISATALLKVDRRDAYGELVKDADGKQLTEDVIRAVTLQPTTGEVEDCSKVEEKIKRQGAGFGWLSLLLIPLVMVRRFKN